MKIKVLVASCILVLSATAASAAAEDIAVVIRPEHTPAQVHDAIVRAAERVCESQFIRGAHSREDLRVCVRDTVDDAVARSDLYAVQTHHRALPESQRYTAPQVTFASR